MKLLLIFVLVSCCMLPASALTYVMTDLGTMGGGSSSAYHINDYGVITGIVNAPDIKQHPDDYTSYFWQNGTIAYLGNFGSKSLSYSLNNQGQVVGQVPAPDYYSNRAALWKNGNRTLLFNVGSSAYDINDKGQIVGYVFCDQPGVGVGAYLWENGEVTILCSGRAYGINNNGVILGSRETVTEQVPFIWKKGILTDLVSPDGSPIYPSDINDLDQVIGFCNNRAVIWDNGVLTDLASLYSVDSVFDIYGFNNSGQVLGQAKVNERSFYFVSQGNVLTELTGTINGINNKGQVVGNYLSSDGSYHAVRWDPVVPEPTSLLVTLSGISSFGALSLLRRKVS